MTWLFCSQEVTTVGELDCQKKILVWVITNTLKISNIAFLAMQLSTHQSRN